MVSLPNSLQRRKTHVAREVWKAVSLFSMMKGRYKKYKFDSL